jgi:hypothetical protein
LLYICSFQAEIELVRFNFMRPDAHNVLDHCFPDKASASIWCDINLVSSRWLVRKNAGVLSVRADDRDYMSESFWQQYETIIILAT